MQYLKKYWPVAFLVFAIIFVFGLWFFVIRGGNDKKMVEDANVPELPFEQRPFTSLTPKEDGHWLNLSIKGLTRVKGAISMDYELLYKVPDGRTQGVPGSVPLTGSDSADREILLGSESSGNFYYDEGVTEGTFTLRFRNDKGKLVGKTTTEFHMQKGVEKLTSIDGNFSYEFDKEPDSDVFFVVMGTLGMPLELGNVNKGPYGVFASDDAKFSGKVMMDGKVQGYFGDGWKELTDNKSSNIGVFVSTSE